MDARSTKQAGESAHFARDFLLGRRWGWPGSCSSVGMNASPRAEPSCPDPYCAEPLGCEKPPSDACCDAPPALCCDPRLDLRAGELPSSTCKALATLALLSDPLLTLLLNNIHGVEVDVGTSAERQHV